MNISGDRNRSTHIDVIPVGHAQTSIVLFTRDLRLDDQPALDAARKSGRRVVGLFVVDKRIIQSRVAAPNRMGLVLTAVAALRSALVERGTSLVVRYGDVADEVSALVREIQADEVHMSADFSRYAIGRRAALNDVAARCRWPLKIVEHPGVAHVAPGDVTPSGGNHFKVFTPYYRRWLHDGGREPINPMGPTAGVDGLAAGRVPSVADLLGVDAARHSSDALPPVAEPDVLRNAAQWIDARLATYGDHNELDRAATSGLSAALHLGTISASRIVALVREQVAGSGDDRLTAAADAFLRQLCWRDFNLQMLAARPDLIDTPLRSEPAWRDDPDAFDAWRNGVTGFPLVDAGMRQLLTHGWMPNRVRMVAASVLTKHLGVDWRLGAWHFMDHLVDGDLANNFCGWQWAAGTGIDTRPNRFVNPFAQSRRHDPDGSYLRRYVPELADLDATTIHEPWAAGQPDGRARDYPPPLIEQAEARVQFAERTA
ncbi:MAG: deoxyribodipyrimidine photo-lyase [Nitriliruptoraceae bacterium]